MPMRLAHYARRENRICDLAIHIGPDKAHLEDGNPGNHRKDSGVLWSSSVENRMRDNQKGSTRGGTFAIIATAFVLALSLLTWGPWNTNHVASNPGPSGTPGSTALDQTPPPAAGPSGTTTGAGR